MANPIDPLSVLNQGGNSVHFSKELFDTLISEHGLQFVHEQAIPCAGSNTDINNTRSHHGDHSCENGFYYKCIDTPFTGVFTNNPNSKNFKSEGIIDSSTAWIICPRTYDNTNKTIYFSGYDKIRIVDKEFKEILVPYFEKLEISATGIDRARFPVCQVEYLIDGFGKEYLEGIDFILENHNIKWITQNRPIYNPNAGHGGVYSIRYLLRPFWFVLSVEHEVRISTTIDDNGEKKQTRFPQYLRCVREIWFRNESNEPRKDDARESFAPPSGNLGYR